MTYTCNVLKATIKYKHMAGQSEKIITTIRPPIDYSAHQHIKDHMYCVCFTIDSEDKVQGVKGHCLSHSERTQEKHR